MLLRALSPDSALSASYLFGDDTPSYQNNSSRFQKLFATFQDQTMTGLILDFSNSSISKLIEVENALLTLFASSEKLSGKRGVSNLQNEREKITFAESDAFSSTLPQSCIRLLKIVGVWDTESEFGLVYKFIRSQPLSNQPFAAHNLD